MFLEFTYIEFYSDAYGGTSIILICQHKIEKSA
jgi:hypothetical protein